MFATNSHLDEPITPVPHAPRRASRIPSKLIIKSKDLDGGLPSSERVNETHLLAPSPLTQPNTAATGLPINLNDPAVIAVSPTLQVKDLEDIPSEKKRTFSFSP